MRVAKNKILKDVYGEDRNTHIHTQREKGEREI